MIDLRLMTDDDIGFATGLTDKLGWGNMDIDFIRLRKLNPSGCFVAWEGRKRLGIITSVVFGSLAFLGNLIVDEKRRGQGIGTSLLRRAIDSLRARNIETIELDGDFPAVSLYRRLGFRDKYLSLRFICPGQRTIPGENFERESEKVDFNEIKSLDAALTGLDRAEFLKSYDDDFPGSAYAVKTAPGRGYAFIRPRQGGQLMLGPLLAESPKIAGELISGLTSYHNTVSIKAGTPETNRDAVEIYAKCGFQHAAPSFRMFLGRRLDYEKNIYAIVSGDVG